jgi:hypothetical protein
MTSTTKSQFAYIGSISKRYSLCHIVGITTENIKDI